MSSIVKSIAIVEKALEGDVPGQCFKHMPARTVLKSRELGGFSSQGLPTQVFSFAPKPAYIDELNRLKVEIEEARAQLSQLNCKIEEANGSRTVGTSRIVIDENEDFTDDQLYHDRLQEIREAVLNAEQEANHVLEEAAQESERIRTTAREEGYQVGFHQGFDEAQKFYIQENQPAAEKLSALLERLNSYEADIIRQNEQDLVTLACAIAGKIIRRELEVNPQTIVPMLEDIVTENQREEYIRITFAPDLMPVEAAVNAEVRDIITGMGANVTVITDRQLPEASCFVETPKGITDLSIPVQQENMKNTLANNS